MASRISLPTYASFLLTNGPSRVTKVLEARRKYASSDSYSQNDFYIHLRAPLRAALAAGDPAPLRQVLTRLEDPKKQAHYEAIVAGLERFIGLTTFEHRPIRKRTWDHAGLQVSVNPTARLRIAGAWHVVYVHLSADGLDARTVAPILALLEETHSDLGAPMVVDARTGKSHRPSTSARMRRGMAQLLRAEAASFLSMWDGLTEVA